ncbi:MAG: 4Fe-4S dicluster domain-containing protein [Candidatus Peregrinibacteria bacterium]|nr:4Fe-4S dicluster domain-containing protein [Candidatus Peregrinibacteria bacterium]
MPKNDSGFKLPKKDLNKLYTALEKFGEVIAPVNDSKRVRMQPVENLGNVSFTGVSWFTSKKYVFPPKQTLVKFNGEKVRKSSPEITKRVLFGLRMCDLNAFAVNDKLFLEQEPKMDFYKKFRESLLLVGLWCDKPVDAFCFCSSMNLQHEYDLCLFDRGDFFHIKVGSEKGEEILKKLKLESDELIPEKPKCKTELKTTDIKDLFEKNEIWKKGEENCLFCGDCTSLCPTCLCFDIEDNCDLSGKCGERCASWDSCMYKDFTKVAGGHHFRGKKIDRFKHRIFHKLQYFDEKFGRSMCTGCGRCIRGCPMKIYWPKIINDEK